MVSTAGLNIDALLAAVVPYAIPVLIILLVLGAIFFVLRNLKWIIILGILAILLMYFGVIPKVNVKFIDSAKVQPDQQIPQTPQSQQTPSEPKPSEINITIVKTAGAQSTITEKDYIRKLVPPRQSSFLK